jgi:hypothetical protein
MLLEEYAYDASFPSESSKESLHVAQKTNC